jgi:hypothetical protein
MKNKIASIVAAVSLLATPAFAGKFNLSEYKTVGVAPVLSSSDARGVFGTELAAQASGLSIGADKGAVAQKAAGKALENSGFGFAGKSGGTVISFPTARVASGSGWKRRMVVISTVSILISVRFIVRFMW